MSALHDIILPVLESMPASHLRQELIRGFRGQSQRFATIEGAFVRLTAGRHDPEVLRDFFHSWSQTNNSAMTVAGIGNRLSLLAREGRDDVDDDALLRVIVSLDRIVDEDLAVTHRILHSQLFYEMATGIVGDDLWLSHRHNRPEAKAFKAWKDANSLREDDLFTALLTTLVHEIYTHGEVEFILPLFRRWLSEDLGFGERDCTRTLAWISVHCGPTEKNHFFHARDAIGHYVAATGVRVEDYPLAEIVAAYLQRKAAVMAALFPAPLESAA